MAKKVDPAYESSGFYVPKGETNSGVWIAFTPEEVLEFDKFHILLVLNGDTDRDYIGNVIRQYNETYEHLLRGKRLVSGIRLITEVNKHFADIKGFVFSKVSLRYYRDEARNGFVKGVHYWSMPVRLNASHIYDRIAICEWLEQRIKDGEYKLRMKGAKGRPANTEKVSASSTTKKRKLRPRATWKPLSSMPTGPMIPTFKQPKETDESGNEKE